MIYDYNTPTMGRKKQIPKKSTGESAPLNEEVKKEKNSTPKKEKGSKSKNNKSVSGRTIRKPYRHKPGVVALQQIRKYQKATEPLLKKTPFIRLVREIAQEMRPDIRWSSAGLEALRHGADILVTTLMEDVNMLAIHARRVTIMKKDIELAVHSRYWAGILNNQVNNVSTESYAKKRKPEDKIKSGPKKKSKTKKGASKPKKEEVIEAEEEEEEEVKAENPQPTSVAPTTETIEDKVVDIVKLEEANENTKPEKKTEEKKKETPTNPKGRDIPNEPKVIHANGSGKPSSEPTKEKNREKGHHVVVEEPPIVRAVREEVNKTRGNKTEPRTPRRQAELTPAQSKQIAPTSSVRSVEVRPRRTQPPVGYEPVDVNTQQTDKGSSNTKELTPYQDEYGSDFNVDQNDT